MTIDEMKAELEATGYILNHHVDGDNSPYEWWQVVAPNKCWTYETDFVQHRGGWLKFKPSLDLEEDIVSIAYAHLQEQKLLRYCIQYIETPRETEMMVSGIPEGERQWFADEIEKRFREIADTATPIAESATLSE